jgi:hypothetical protein
MTLGAITRRLAEAVAELDSALRAALMRAMIYIALLTACILLMFATSLTVAYAVDRLIHPTRTPIGGPPSDYGLPCENVSFHSMDGTTL